MKNYLTGLVVALLAVLAVTLWRLERDVAPLAELARVQLADREEARRLAREQAEQARRDAEIAREQAEQEARARADAEAHAARQAREEAARIAHLAEPVKPGEVVPEVRLDNHDTVRDAVVVAVQPTSVSFRVGTRLYNIPTEQLPPDLRERLRRMFPAPPTEVPAF